MSTLLLVHFTGLAALVLNVRAMLHRNDLTLRKSSGIASLLWALNNLLIGAETAAALSVLSAGRTATSVVMERRAARLRAMSCVAFGVLALAIAVFTYDGLPTVLTATASIMVTYAMFYLRGVALRLVLIASAALWMVNAIVFNSWEQFAAQVLSASSAAYSAWKVRRQPAIHA